MSERHISEGHAHAPCGAYLNRGLPCVKLESLSDLEMIECRGCLRKLLDATLSRLIDLGPPSEVDG